MWKKLTSKLGLTVLAIIAIGLWTWAVLSPRSSPLSVKDIANAILCAVVSTFFFAPIAIGIVLGLMALIWPRLRPKLGDCIDKLFSTEGYTLVFLVVLSIFSWFEWSSASPTAICTDGTYSYSQTRSGTCSHHGGVKEWLPVDNPP
jgi:hypothetical protein